jgi:hypothetical protein
VVYSENKELWDIFYNKYNNVLEEEWICEKRGEKLLFFPEFEDEEFENNEEFEIPYDHINRYGVGQEVTDYHFYSVSQGTNWTFEQEQRPNEFYFFLQKIFGDFWFGLVVVDDEDETRLMIRVTENNIEVTENN